MAKYKLVIDNPVEVEVETSDGVDFRILSSKVLKQNFHQEVRQKLLEKAVKDKYSYQMEICGGESRDGDDYLWLYNDMTEINMTVRVEFSAEEGVFHLHEV